MLPWERPSLTGGDAPDPRFTLANERTFLAWVRTALTLVAGGIGVDAFLAGYPAVVRTVLAVSLLLLGGTLAATSYLRWLRVERALRAGEAPPPSITNAVLAATVGLLGLVLLAVVILN